MDDFTHYFQMKTAHENIPLFLQLQCNHLERGPIWAVKQFYENTIALWKKLLEYTR